MKQKIVILFLCMFLLCWGCDSKATTPANENEGTETVTEKPVSTENSPMVKAANFKLKIEYCTS
ncbi:MAG: hypothetical protein HUU50_17190 [Candidatus Brocadiae bacterium]|nr:hypothetical protein [Candidatus Brocadiia bacterium]